jgi:hypothetical protein
MVQNKNDGPPVRLILLKPFQSDVFTHNSDQERGVLANFSKKIIADEHNVDNDSQDRRQSDLTWSPIMSAGRRFPIAHATSTPWLRPATAEFPGLVACPIPGAGVPEAVQEMYRLAYERAQAEARPTAYERALCICLN